MGDRGTAAVATRAGTSCGGLCCFYFAADRWHGNRLLARPATIRSSLGGPATSTSRRCQFRRRVRECAPERVGDIASHGRGDDDATAVRFGSCVRWIHYRRVDTSESSGNDARR